MPSFRRPSTRLARSPRPIARQARATRLAARAGAAQPITLESLEPRIVLSTADTFHAPVYIDFRSAGSSSLVDFAVGDLNNDGMDDVVAVDGNDLYITTSFRGAYRDPIAIDLTSSGRVEIADLTGDGNLDIAVLDTVGTGTVTTLINNGNGTFGAPITAESGLSQVIDWAVADLNADGLADFALLSDSFFRTYLSTGGGNVASITNLENAPVGVTWNHIDTGDVDGDGNVDVAFVADNFQNRVRLGDGAGNLAAASTTSSATSLGSTVDFRLVDTSGNGRVDYLVTLDNFGQALVQENTSTVGSVSANNDNVAATQDAGRMNLAVGDINGDGIADLVSHSDDADGFTVWYATPSNDVSDFFETTSNYVVNENTDRTRLGDANGDGRLDAFGMDGRAVIIHANLGNGVFTAPEVSYLSNNSNDDFGQTLFGDLDGDGQVDAVAFVTDSSFDFNSRTVSISFGVLGRFGSTDRFVQTDFETSGGNSILGGTLADTDGDGDQDIVLVGDGYGSTFVQVIRNDGDRNFTLLERGRIAGNEFAINDVWGGQLNAGNKEDIIVADADNKRLIILAGLGNGNVTLIDRVRIGTTPHGIEVADMDGDGDRDVILATDTGVSVMVEEGNFSYGQLISTVFGGGARDVAVGNYNPGSAPDVAAIVGDGYGEFVFLRNQSSAPDQPFLRKLPQTNFALGGDIMPDNITQGDVNGDGITDFILHAIDDHEGTMILNGDGFLGVAEGGYFETRFSGNGPFSPALADADNDGDLDLLYLGDLGSVDGAGIAIFRNYGDGTFVLPDKGQSGATTRVPLPPVGNSGSPVVTADFNNDGLVDIATLEEDSEGTPQVAIYLNTGDGFDRALLLDLSFVAPGFNLGFGQLVAGNVGGNARPDLVVYNDADDRHYTLINNGNGTSFTPMLAHSQADFQYEDLALADMTGDGFLDIVATSSGDDVVVIMPGRGDGTFRNGAVRVVVNVPLINSGSHPHIYDANNDGALDFAISRNLNGTDYDVRLHIQTNPSLYAFQTIGSAPAQPSGIGDQLYTADVDGNGVLDLLFSSRDFGTEPQHHVAYGSLSGGVLSVTQLTFTPPGTDQRAGHFLAADIDNDGRLELIALGDATTIYELNAAGVPVASTVLALDFRDVFRIQFLDTDADGDLDLIGTFDSFGQATSAAVIANRTTGTVRTSNVAPAIPGGSIFLETQEQGAGVEITYEDFLARSGVTDADGDEVRFRIVNVANGSLSGPGGIISGNNTFRPGTSIFYTAPSGPGTPSSVVAFRVTLSDPFGESSVVIPVRVPLTIPPIMMAPITAAPTPPPPPTPDSSPSWLDFDPLDLASLDLASADEETIALMAGV